MMIQAREDPGCHSVCTQYSAYAQVIEESE